MQNIYWIDPYRFDSKIDKSTPLEIAEILISENFSVTLLCGFKKQKYIPQGYRLKIKYFRSINIPGLYRYLLSANIFFWLIRKIKQEDIVILMPEGLYIGLLLKLIKCCNVHLDVRTIPVDIHTNRNRIHCFLFWTLPFNLFKHVPDSFSFITERLKQSVEQEFQVVYPDYVTWHSGVNTVHFPILKNGSERQLDKFVLTYLGIITKNRGIRLVMNAFSKLKGTYKENIIFQVIGEGPDLENLKSISSDLEITKRVDFKGYIKYEFIPEHLRGTDCFICPLPDRPEWNVSSPIKVFEYLACGKPIILTPIAAHKAIVNNEDFIVWTDGDTTEDFVKAIKYAYENRVMLTEAAKRAPDLVREKYEWKVQGKKLADYLKRKYCVVK